MLATSRSMFPNIKNKIHDIPSSSRILPSKQKNLSGHLLDSHDQINEHILMQTRDNDVTLIQDGSQQSCYCYFHPHKFIDIFSECSRYRSNKKTASFCASLFQKAMSEAETKFRCRTVGIVTYNERIMEAMRNKLYEVDNSLITYGCSSHLLILVQDITPQQIIYPVIDVSKYFRNHHTPGALLSELLLSGKIR